MVSKILPFNYRRPTRGKRILKKMRSNWLSQSFMEVVRVFCRETTLHGMKHIFGSSSEYSRWHKRLAVRISRFLWFLSCVAGIVCAVIMMRLVWIRFAISPTITTIDTTNHPIWEVPFPSVTICNINKVYAPSAENITRQLLDKGVPHDRILTFYSMVPNLINPVNVEDEFLNISLILGDLGYTTETLMMELVQPCEEMVKLCFWKGYEKPCNELFKLSRSTEGLCCSFNYIAIRAILESDPEFNYSTQSINYLSGAGKQVGLRIMMDSQAHQSLGMSRTVYGLEVLIHDPNEFPQASITSAVAQPSAEVILSITPSVINSKATIRDVPVNERQCYFEDEVKLRATRKYTMNSCLAECRVDYIVKKCNCLPFFYPDIPEMQNRYHQCGFGDINCLKNINVILSSMQPPDGTVGFNTSEEVGLNCQCYPACSETSYQVSTISVRRDPRLRSMTYRYTSLENMTTLYVYFKDLTCIRYRRDLYMTWDGLFASFGGIFSLCLGGSILSLVEMAYFFTIRLLLTTNRRIMDTKKGKLVVRQELKEHVKSNNLAPGMKSLYRTTWAQPKFMKDMIDLQ